VPGIRFRVFVFRKQGPGSVISAINHNRKVPIMKHGRSSRAGIAAGAVAALFIVLAAGCSDSDNVVDPLNQPPAGVNDEQAAIRYIAANEDFSANDEQTMNDGQLQPAEYGVAGKVAADITPIRFGRFIRNVTRNVEVAVGPGDTVAEAMVTKDIYGVFRIRGVAGSGDTVTVSKEFHDRAHRRVIFRRVDRDSVRWWRNWIPVGSSLIAGGTVEPNDNIAITKTELFLPNGDTVTVSDPLGTLLRYRWGPPMPHPPDGGMMDSTHRDPPPVPELLDGQELTMRVTVRSASADTDLVALRFGCDLLHKRRAQMRLVSEKANGDGTFTRVFARTWTVPPLPGFFHVAVDAATRGTVFDDAEPYSVSWWGMPYRVF
jgi:hypothetical protein